MPAPNDLVPAPNDLVPAPNDLVPAPNDLVPAPNDLVAKRPEWRLGLYWAGPTHDETVTSVPTGS